MIRKRECRAFMLAFPYVIIYRITDFRNLLEGTQEAGCLFIYDRRIPALPDLWQAPG